MPNCPNDCDGVTTTNGRPVSYMTNIDMSSLLYKLYEQIRIRMYETKNKYPLLRDYLNILMRELEETKDNFDKTSPTTSELKSQFYLRIIRMEEILSKIENGQYPYLADKSLYILLTRAQEHGSKITNLYIKLLIASNILDLVINDKLANVVDRDKYARMVKSDNIISKVQELNKHLKQYDKEIQIPKIVSMTGMRNIVDHPESEIIRQIDEKDVSELIKFVDQVIDMLEGPTSYDLYIKDKKEKLNSP